MYNHKFHLYFFFENWIMTSPPDVLVLLKYMITRKLIPSKLTHLDTSNTCNPVVLLCHSLIHSFQFFVLSVHSLLQTAFLTRVSQYIFQLEGGKCPIVFVCDHHCDNIFRCECSQFCLQLLSGSRPAGVLDFAFVFYDVFAYCQLYRCFFALHCSQD